MEILPTLISRELTCEGQEEPPSDEEILHLFVPWSCRIPLKGLGVVGPGVLEVAVRFWIIQPHSAHLGEADATAALWDAFPACLGSPVPRSGVGAGWDGLGRRQEVFGVLGAAWGCLLKEELGGLVGAGEVKGCRAGPQGRDDGDELGWRKARDLSSLPLPFPFHTDPVLSPPAPGGTKGSWRLFLGLGLTENGKSQR